MPADLTRIAEWLNTDDEIAYLVAAGPGRWRAVEAVSELALGRTVLWHTLGGSLPLLRADLSEAAIADPFAGWVEQVADASGRIPFFGSIPAIVTLDVPDSIHASERVPMLAFGWIGARYQASGRPPTPATAAWWRRLQQWVARTGHKVQRAGLSQGPGSTVYAFPAAREQLAAGIAGELNPPSL